jgi:tetratricopeptide (TPR) repeat protein
VKIRFFKFAVIALVGFLALGIYWKVNRQEPGTAHTITNQAEQKQDRLLKAHENLLPSKQHEAEMLKTVLVKSPQHVPVLFRLAQIESESGNFQDSAGHLRKILELSPDNLEANLELGKVLFQSGDTQGAIACTERILKTHPNYEDALYNMGAIYANIGNKKEAMAYWRRLSALHSTSTIAQNAQLMMNKLGTNNP